MNHQLSPKERLAYLQPAPEGGESNPLDHIEQERFTDVGNARRVVRDHGQDLRWVPTWCSWLAWDGKRWRRDTKGEVVQRAKRVAAALWEEAAAEIDSERRKQAGKWAMQSESAQRIEAMIRLARTEPGIPVEAGELDADPWLLNTTTGTLNLRTGQLQPHRRSDLITKITAAGYKSTAECVAWERFLEQVIPDEDVRSFLQRAVGYALTGLTNEHVLFFFHGPVPTARAHSCERCSRFSATTAVRRSRTSCLQSGTPIPREWRTSSGPALSSPRRSRTVDVWQKGP